MEYVLIFIALCAVNLVSAKECDTDDDCVVGKECCIAKSFMKSNIRECKKYLKEGDICLRNIQVMKEVFGFTFGVTPCGPGLTCATTEELLYTVDDYDVYSTRCFKKSTSFNSDKEVEDITGKTLNDVSSKDMDKVTSKELEKVKSKDIEKVKSKETEEIKSKYADEVKSEDMDEVKSEDMGEVKSEDMGEVKSEDIDEVKSKETEEVKSKGTKEVIRGDPVETTSDKIDDVTEDSSE